MTTRKSESKLTIAALGKALGVSVRRVHQLQSAGMPTDSLESAQAWRKSRGNSDSVEELRQERIQLVAAQRRRIETENAVRSGQLVEAAQVEASCQAAASIAKMRLLQLAQSLPPRLAGLTEARMAKIIHGEILEALEHLSEPGTYAET